MLLEFCLSEDFDFLNDWIDEEVRADYMQDKYEDLQSFSSITELFSYAIKKMIEKDPEERHDFDQVIECFKVSTLFPNYCLHISS